MSATPRDATHVMAAPAVPADTGRANGPDPACQRIQQLQGGAERLDQPGRTVARDLQRAEQPDGVTFLQLGRTRRGAEVQDDDAVALGGVVGHRAGQRDDRGVVLRDDAAVADHAAPVNLVLAVTPGRAVRQPSRRWARAAAGTPAQPSWSPTVMISPWKAMRGARPFPRPGFHGPPVPSVMLLNEPAPGCGLTFSARDRLEEVRPINAVSGWVLPPSTVVRLT